MSFIPKKCCSCHSDYVFLYIKEYSEYANNDFDHIGARYHYIKL